MSLYFLVSVKGEVDAIELRPSNNFHKNMAKKHLLFNRISILSISLIIVSVAIEIVFSDFDERILGGDETSRGDWPFMASLFEVETQKFFCGGTLISQKHVLTGNNDLVINAVLR